MALRTAPVVLFLSFAAHASPPPAYDVVVERDGTLLQGHVAELKPGQSVTLQLLTGEARVVPWDEIAETRGPSFPAPPVANPQPASCAASAEPVELGGGDCKCAVGAPTPPPIDPRLSALSQAQRRALRGRSLVGILLLPPAAAGIVGGTVLAVQGHMDPPPRTPAGHAAPSAINGLDVTGYIMIGVGAAVLTTAIVLFATDHARDKLPPMQVGLAPTANGGALSLTGRF
jgi:hypothetical protein